MTRRYRHGYRPSTRDFAPDMPGRILVVVIYSHTCHKDRQSLSCKGTFFGKALSMYRNGYHATLGTRHKKNSSDSRTLNCSLVSNHAHNHRTITIHKRDEGRYREASGDRTCDSAGLILPRTRKTNTDIRVLPTGLCTNLDTVARKSAARNPSQLAGRGPIAGVKGVAGHKTPSSVS